MAQQQADRPIAYRRARVVAGIWFACAAAIPTAYFFRIIWPLGGPDSVASAVFLFGPLLAGGISGAALGVRILDPARVTRGRQAVWRGILVALFAFILYMMFAGWALVITPARNFTIDLLITAPFMVLVVGTIVAARTVGWLLLLTGAVAGWLLYYLRRLWIAQDGQSPAAQ